MERWGGSVGMQSALKSLQKAVFVCPKWDDLGKILGDHIGVFSGQT